MRRAPDPLVLHVALSLAVVGLAFGVCTWAWPEGGPARQAAMAGVWLSAGSGALSLALFRRAKSVKQALLVVVGLFVVRILMVAVGAMMIRGSGGVMPFVFGFLGTYFALQWVEMHYFIAENKRGERTEQRSRETK